MGLNIGNIARLSDVVLTGPIQLMVASRVQPGCLQLFMIITGIMTIVYNGYVYLSMKGKVPTIPRIIDKIEGKTQIHRLFNVFVMYPIFMHVFLTTKLPLHIKVAFMFEIIFGTLFNLKNYLAVTNSFLFVNTK